MKKTTYLLPAFTLLLLLAGCGAGIIYTHTWTPLTTNLHRTPVAEKSAEGDIKHIQIMQAGIAWDDASFGTIARKSGFKEIHFADLETMRVLRIWNQYTVHLYGK